MEAQAGSRHQEIVLLHELSSGTFARLYLAEARAHGGIERIVAVKILREQWNESTEIINRTRDEARLLARLRHKNILRVEDLTEIDGQLAIIMEFVDGLDIKQLVEALTRNGQRVPPRAALQICAESASALEAAYFKIPYGLDAPLNVVHRDVKPSNVMVSVEGEVKVLDFGTARSSQALRAAQTGALRFGSLKYMSPERREGDRGEHPADVYALGLMLLEVLRAEWLPLLPLDPLEHDEAITAAVNKLMTLGMPNREWDTALRQVMLQMLNSEPSVRPTAEQTAKLLRAFADQASGDSLEAFAAAQVGPLARQIRGNLTGGALAGTRFVLNSYDSTSGGRVAGARALEEAPEPVAPPPRSSPEAPARPSLEARPRAGVTQVPALNTEETPPAGVAPRPAGRAARTWPPEGPRPDDDPVTARLNAPSGPPQSPHAAPRVERSERATPPRRSEDGGGGGGLVMAAGGAVALLALACGGVTLAGGGWYMFSAQTPGTPPVTPPITPPVTPAIAALPTPVPTAAAVMAGNATVTVTTAGAAVQWIHLDTTGGERVLSGSEGIDGTVPADTYDLSMKVVGRLALKGAVAVPESGLTLRCSAQKEGTMRCEGVEPPLVLKP